MQCRVRTDADRGAAADAETRFVSRRRHDRSGRNGVVRKDVGDPGIPVLSPDARRRSQRAERAGKAAILHADEGTQTDALLLAAPRRAPGVCSRSSAFAKGALVDL